MSALRHEEEAPRGFVPKSELYKALAEIDRLKAELEELRGDRDEDMALDDLTAIRTRFRIPPQCARLLSALFVNHHPISAERLVEVANLTSKGIIRTRKHYLSRALIAAGAPADWIESRAGADYRGGGYRITPQGRAWLVATLPEIFAKGATR